MQKDNRADIALPDNYVWVDEYLIRGPHPCISDIIRLRQQPIGVTQIFDFRHISNWHFKFIEKWCCKVLGIKYIRVPYSNLYGDYPQLSLFEDIANSVRQNGEEGGKTLFHCNSGRHRTAHFSAFYKLTKGMPLKTVQMQLGPEYENTVLEIIKDQIIDKNYFNRKIVDYHGINPLNIEMVKHNNLVAAALVKAHEYFLRRLGCGALLIR